MILFCGKCRAAGLHLENGGCGGQNECGKNNFWGEVVGGGVMCAVWIGTWPPSGGV